MALGLTLERSGDGQITQVVKYNAKAGRIARVDRVGERNEEVDITREFRAVIDMENIETGWILFETGSAPHFELTKLGTGMPAKPSDKHREGLRVMCKLHASCAGGQEAVREIACTAMAALKGFDALHNAYNAGREANPGQLPVIVLGRVETDKVESKNGTTTNYIPVWEIVAWAPRPADLTYQPRTPNAQPAPASSGSGAPSGSATGSTQVGPPAAQQQQQPAQQPAPAVVDNDFG